MPIKTKRWNDPVEPDDGLRLLVTRYRPRALRKADETWDEWKPDLGPSRELHARIYGKRGAPPLPWSEVRPLYLGEMREPARRAQVDALAARVAAGQTVTLMCSNACVDPDRCHRTLLARLVDEAVLSYRRDGRHPVPRAAQGVPRRPR